MHIVKSIEDLRRLRSRWRSEGQRVGFVPTMGNLHRGHLSLVEQAADQARVLVSIFVNPLQFGPGEDLDAYPRTLDDDLRQLRGQGLASAVFIPGVAMLYPRGLDDTTRVSVPVLESVLCGAQRPGHFTGVATVVNILFNLVQPDVAVFGRKDYQQLLIIRRMVEDLHMPIELRAGQTVREADGLAMSSRNGYLDADQRAAAPALYRALQSAAQGLSAGEADYAGLERQGVEALAAAGFNPDYFSILDADDLGVPGPGTARLLFAAAARLGRTRLIDNLCMDRQASGAWAPC